MDLKTTGQPPVPALPGLPAELAIQQVFHRAADADAKAHAAADVPLALRNSALQSVPLSGQAQRLDNASSVHAMPGRSSSDSANPFQGQPQAQPQPQPQLNPLDQLAAKVASNQVANLLSGIPPLLIESVQAAAQQSGTVIVLDRARSQSNFRAMHEAAQESAVQWFFALPDGRTFISTSSEQTMAVVTTLAACGYITAPQSLWPRI
ncbi:MAG: hypothetical protein ACRYGK_12045 [Janthinobacterium lividum]